MVANMGFKTAVTMLLMTGFFCTCTNQAVDLHDLEYERVVNAADTLLDKKPITVTAARSERSLGGLHDYYSEGDYWWPDPDNPDGPYIRRDGLSNPGNFDDHRLAMRRLSIHAATLTAAYLLTKDEKYAQKAIEHMEAWFVADATRMSPNLLYSQAIKGRVSGRGIGIIDTIHLMEVARSAQVLEREGALRGEKLEAIKSWFSDYVSWLTTHEYGISERDHPNNHGTWWTAQVAVFADFTGNDSIREFCREHFKNTLLPNQTAEDGSFPLELERTKPYNYALFNLDGMAMICHVLSTEGDDLWRHSVDGKSIAKAMDFMFPYIKDKSTWPYPPDVQYFEFYPIRHISLLLAGKALNKPAYIEVWETLEADPKNEEVIRNNPIRQPLLWTKS